MNFFLLVPSIAGPEEKYICRQTARFDLEVNRKLKSWLIINKGSQEIKGILNPKFL
jgi:hypothetical protein